MAPARAHLSAVRAQSALTSFVGRDEDVPRVLKNLRAARLITLTGPGGVGKTRLAAEASARADVTAWFVPLARLAAALADRDEVMVLDNCEHVIGAAAALAGYVLAACPRMRILATSRQPLRIDGETLCPVLPLRVPPALPAPAAPVGVASYGSVWLRTLTAAQLAERLDDRFALLTGGSRTALPRHRTLRAVVDWSWDQTAGPP